MTADILALEAADLDALFSLLVDRGYTVIAPALRDGAIVYEPVDGAAQLPIGWSDRQGPGSYRLERRPDEARFGYVVGPNTWKRYLHPPRATVWAGRRVNGSFTTTPPDPAPRYAFIGVRPCELAAMSIQDAVFMEGSYVDPTYAARRNEVFLVAVNCTEPGGTCFCGSMGTGPAATSGYDIAMTEVLDGNDHYFVVTAGSEAGAGVCRDLSSVPADPSQVEAERLRLEAAAGAMGRTMDTSGIKELLYGASTSAHWEAVAVRCLACANCTMACPTCFCATVEDVQSLDGTVAERVRSWDSCFTWEFSYIHGGSLRTSGAARYRQWLTHKLASWIDQFGTSGCVGCGRCITWCPVGIDITEEVASLREQEAAHAGS